MSNRLSDPQQEFQIAQDAFRQGDLPHAVHHLAWALAADATNTKYLGLLDKVIRRANNPRELIPAQDTMSYAEAAVRAFILAERGDMDQAMILLMQVLRVSPTLSHLPWLVSWLTDSRKRRRVSPEAMTRVLASLGNLLNDVPRLGEQLARTVFSVEKYVRSHDEHGLLLGAFASFVRRLGERDKAIVYARQGYETLPGAPTGIFLGATYRHAGRYDEAIDAYQKALRHDPGNDEVRIDIADLLCLTEQVEEGLVYYELVLSRIPDHPWAAMKYYYHKYQLTQDESWKEKLAEFAKSHPDETHVSHALGLLGDPFIDYLPEPRDATISILRQMSQQGVKPSRDTPIGLSHLESPSAIMAAHMYSGQPLAVTVANIQTPDPRYPRRKVKYVLWSYKGTAAVSSLDPPRQSALEAVFSLARQPYSLQGWTDQAAQIAAHFGGDYLRELLKVMVHPPYPEAGFMPWTWIYRAQVAAALIIAQLEGEWGTSEKREALISLALGPMDWTVDAALIALFSVCLSVEEARADTIEVMRELAENPPDAGAVHYFGALVHCGLRLPGLPPDLRETLKDLEQYL